VLVWPRSKPDAVEGRPMPLGSAGSSPSAPIRMTEPKELHPDCLVNDSLTLAAKRGGF
jgi:hypothetical protein